MKCFVFMSAAIALLAGCSKYHPAEVSTTPPRWTEEEIASFHHFMESLRLMEELKKELPELRRPGGARRLEAMYRQIVREAELVDSEGLVKAHPDLPRVFELWYLPWLKDQYASNRYRFGDLDYGRYEMKQWNAWCKENWKNVRSPNGKAQHPGLPETEASGDKKETAAPPSEERKSAVALNNGEDGANARKEFDTAIVNVGKVTRADSKQAFGFYNRGNAKWRNNEFDEAILDYNEAIRLDPKYVLAYRGRGFAWYLKEEYDKAIQDFDKALRLDPKEAYSGIYGHFAARCQGDSATAQRFLNDSARNLNNAWPYPLVRFLRGEIGEAQLLKLADNGDKQTEAHCYLGMDLAIKRHKNDAIVHFLWVKEHGNKTFFEYAIAEAELERLQ
jgi:tetratricopeptide (TPR) repeat protein